MGPGSPEAPFDASQITMVSDERKESDEVAQVEADVSYFENPPSLDSIIQSLKEEERSSFVAKNGVEPEDEGVFSQEDIVRGLRYDVVDNRQEREPGLRTTVLGDQTEDEAMENTFQDRLTFSLEKIPREPLISGAKLGFAYPDGSSVSREFIMSKCADAARKKLEALRPSQEKPEQQVRQAA